MGPRLRLDRALLPGIALLALCAARPLAAADAPRAAIVAPRAAVDAGDLALRRATFAWRANDLREVVTALETIDFAAAPAFDGADRAAFLLAQAYLELGAAARFVALADAVAAWPAATPYTRWLAYQRVLIVAEDGAGGAKIAGAPDPATASADAVAADGLLRAGRAGEALERLGPSARDGAAAALSLYVRSLAQTAAGESDNATLEALTHADTVSAVGRDLAGLAWLRLATRALAANADPRPLLIGVPAGSAYAARARHMHGLYALERGERAEGAAILGALTDDAENGALRREAMLALAGLALEGGDWSDAHARYLAIETDRNAAAETLERAIAAREFAPLWDAWKRGAAGAPSLILDGDAVHAASLRVAARSIASGATLESVPPALDRGPRSAAPVLAPAPPLEDWRRLAVSARAVDENLARLERTRWAATLERERLAGQRDYFGHGAGLARHEEALLIARGRMLDSLRASLEDLDARLRAVRDASSERLVRRARRMIAAGEAHLAWLGAMRLYHLDGAHHAAEHEAPAEHPSADSLARAEEALAHRLIALGRRIEAGTPDLIARSYAEAWRPGLIDRTVAQSDRARLALAWARRVAAGADSNLAAAAGSETLVALEAEAARLTQRAQALASSHAMVSDSIAEAAAQRGLAALTGEREAIDYGLATAVYGIGVALERAPAGAIAAAAAGADPLEDSVAVVARAEGIERMRAFLERHPGSEARGEMRFRLADLLLIEARRDFRERMAAFIDAQSAGRASGAPPLLDHGPALELYAAILAEDRGFEHLDAVLFNAGMILADDGDPSAARYFTELVEAHPQSVYRQESWLRMGDMRFNDRDYAEAGRLYAEAATGADPNLRVMALYKMGWAHSNEDRFLDAADAFRAALDLYGSEERARIGADVEKESETYLVHSLARAGGAGAFAAYFDRVGERPYERRILMALADHFRRYSLFEEAAAADAMNIARHPLHPDALASAQRLPETWLRAGAPAAARAAQLEQAPRFAPESPWAKAQESDSVRAAGAVFARDAWTTVALHHHLEARAKGGAADWQQALALYGVLIRTWPEAPQTPEYHLFAGEASDHLGDPRTSLGHYRAAADAGADSVAERALRQRVAVTDAWYERTRSTGSTATGRDSLATAVLAAADELLARFPAHEGGADIRWRQGHLAFAHGWYERAALDFGHMANGHAADRRAPAAAALKAEALFRIERFDAAGEAFEAARLAATGAGNDSLAARAAAAVPVCHFRHAESVARDDTGNPARHAELFARVAERWPAYEHAHLAQYRAALAWLEAPDAPRGVAAMRALIERFPASEYVKDAHLRIASTYEKEGDLTRAAEAYADFGGRFASDSLAASAWLRSADLFDSAGAAPRAEAIRLDYLDRYPDDHEAALEILEPLARRELAKAGPAVPISALLAAGAKAGPRAPLTGYLARAARHPALASRDLLAEVRWLEAEEARAACEAVRLTLPLDKSIAKRQAALDTLLARCRRTVDMGVPRFAHAATYRIGEALIRFGEALEASERPADISGDDRLAYEDVLVEKSQAFYDRGEQVWEELLRAKGRDAAGDTWIAEARGALWKRLGERFYFKPEVEFPSIEEKAPAMSADSAKAGDARTAAPSVAQREDHP
jgi:TolA-binding protein